MAPSRKVKPKRPWQEIAKEAQEHRDASIAPFATALASETSINLPRNSTTIPRNVLLARDLQITETLPEELVKLLANGDISATDVTTAFLRRAALAQKLVSISLSLFFSLEIF